MDDLMCAPDAKGADAAPHARGPSRRTAGEGGRIRARQRRGILRHDGGSGDAAAAEDRGRIDDARDCRMPALAAKCSLLRFAAREGGSGPGSGPGPGSGTATATGSEARAAPKLRIFRAKPKDARAASDLNWEGWLTMQRLRDTGAAAGAAPTPSAQQGAVGSRVGPFQPLVPLPDKQAMMLREMRPAFEGEDAEATLDALVDMVTERTVPLRLLDWFVSRYAQRHRMTREVQMPDGSSAVLDVYAAYRNDRWAVRKRHWDFFCKRLKLAFEHRGERYVTSLSQLNAFLFVRRFRIRALLLKRRETVERDMEEGRARDEAAALRAAERAAREAGLPEGAPLQRKRGRRRKPTPEDPDYVPPTEDMVMLSAVSVQTRVSLQDEGWGLAAPQAKEAEEEKQQA